MTTPSAGASQNESPRDAKSWLALWAIVATQGALLVAFVFAAYELFERTVLKGASPPQLHVVHMARGIGTAFLLATWSFLQVRRERMDRDALVLREVDRLESRVRERTHELEEARAFTELLFNALRERIVVFDETGTVVKANRVAEESAASPLVGRKCCDVFSACSSARRCFADDIGTSAIATVETRADANGRVWELEAIPVPALPGRPAVVIEVGRDVTVRRNLEAQVRHQEKMASLGMLAAGFAHDLGNPLASLSTELELLEGETDVSMLRDSLGVLRRHVGRMSRTLREMVDFARRRREEVADVSIAGVVADSARLVCHDPRWKRIQLQTDIPGDVPPVRMVEDHLVLVLVNLMINASDAMPDGGTLRISASRVDGHVELRVSDTGTGMGPDILEKAMTPLFSTKPKERGTGLGLSVCRNVLHAVGGELALSSTVGLGTVVTISLPASGDIDA